MHDAFKLGNPHTLHAFLKIGARRFESMKFVDTSINRIVKTCDLKTKTFKLIKTCLWICTFTCAETASRYSRIASTRYKCTLVFLKVLSWFIRPSGLWNKTWQGFQIQRNYCWCRWFLLTNKNRFRPWVLFCRMTQTTMVVFKIMIYLFMNTSPSLK